MSGRQSGRAIALLMILLSLCAHAALAARPARKPARPPAAGKAPPLRWAFPPSGLSKPLLDLARRERAGEWLNSAPLLAAAQNPSGEQGVVSLDPVLKGKPVLIHFWDYTDIHCLRLVPYLSAWHDRYARDGLVIVAVHAPAFPFTAAPSNVAAAVQRFGIRYPVTLDSDFLLWKVFHNQVWPRTILIRPGGEVVFDHLGDEGTGRMETAIRGTLELAMKKKYTAPLVPPPSSERGAACHDPTRDVFCGFRRGRLGTPGYRKDGAATPHTIPSRDADRQEGVIYLAGNWRATDQALFPVGGGPWELRLKARATGFHVVMEPPAGGAIARVRVALDGKPVTPKDRMSDVRAVANGETIVSLDAPRLYSLLAGTPFGPHEIGLHPETAEIGFYLFTFEGCEARPAGAVAR